MTFGGISFLVAYVHTCYVVKEVFNKIFPQENIGVWGTLPVNCERRACLGVFWEFVIFTIPKKPNCKPLAMFTNLEIRPLKCSFSFGFIKILSQRYFCILSSFIFYHLRRQLYGIILLHHIFAAYSKGSQKCKYGFLNRR